MNGIINPRSLYRLDDAWAKVLNANKVDKFVVFSAQNKVEQVDSVYHSLLSEMPENYFVPPVAHMTYLGFGCAPQGLFFRSVSDKEFSFWFAKGCHLNFYPSQKFEEQASEFKFGDPIVLLEGPKDVEAFSFLTGYPYVVGYLTSAVSPKLGLFLSSLTDKFLLVPDNDDVGKKLVYQSKKNLQRIHTRVKVMETKAKDFGDLFFAPDKDEIMTAVGFLENF
jgi:hypothetical protein